MKDKLLTSLRSFMPTSLSFAVTFIALRLYEYFAIAGRVADSGYNVFGSLHYDMGFIFSVCLVVFVVYFFVHLFHAGIANVLSLVVFGFIIVIGFSVTEYFATTLIPLSADFFGYTTEDIRTTISASGGLNLRVVVMLILFVSFFVAVSLWMQRRNAGTKIPTAVAIIFLVLLALTFVLPHNPRPEQYNNTLSYYVAVNKTQYFVARSSAYFTQSMLPTRVFDANEYPFLRDIKYEDKLGNYLAREETLPNLVFVVVEGLGRDFMGPNAPYGGFTPFLDSLAGASLFWQNTLSNAGRTFGVLPSMLGALPYGQTGLMHYGARMPEHQTLISLLKPYGYAANFFYGGNANFDNMDVFLEYQGIDYILSEGNFPHTYEKMKTNAGGFTWGYADHDVFMHSLDVLKDGDINPRIDIYLTLATHEPFVTPEKRFDEMVESRLRDLTNLSAPARRIIAENKGVFSCLLYTDHAIRSFVKAYSQRDDFRNTIFIITGDHRLIPVPPAHKLSRFHVPLIIYSPLLTTKQTFSAIAAHSCIPATVLGFLGERYKLKFPAQLPFISDALSTDTVFTSNVDVALIRNKNETHDYVEGKLLLSEGALYKILPNLEPQPFHDNTSKKRLASKLSDFKAKGDFALNNNQLDKRNNTGQRNLFTFTPAEERYLQKENIAALNADQQFFMARKLAFEKKYNESRAILHSLLNSSPGYHDARILLARTYAWNEKYDTARIYLEQVRKRAPHYVETYVAWADVEFWDDQDSAALAIVKEGLKADSTSTDLMAREARALWKLGRSDEARMLAKQVVMKDPEHAVATEVLHKLQ